MVLQGTVLEKEAKGYLIDLHTGDRTQGFLKTEGEVLKKGERILVSILEKMKKSRTVVKLGKFNPESTLSYSQTTAFEAVKPGFRVEAKVSKIVDNGIHVTFCNGVEGVIFEDHCNKGLKQYKKTEKLQARVISIDYQKKIIALSTKSHIVDYTPAKPVGQEGDLLEKVKVARHLYGDSYIVEGTVKGTDKTAAVFLHSSHVGPDSVSKITQKKREKKVGIKPEESEEITEVILVQGDELVTDVRIKEINHFDNIAFGSATEAIVSKSVLSWNALAPEQKVKAEILSVHKDKYVTVQLNEFIQGRVYREHLSEIPHQTIADAIKNKVGKRIKVKVLSVDPVNRLVELTAKESLLKDKKKMPTSSSDPILVAGQKFTGVVVGKNDHAYLVRFWGTLKGFIRFD